MTDSDIQATITWNQIDIQYCHSPLVYVFWKDKECLYVGMSGNGMERPLSINHCARAARKISTKIEFHIVKNELVAGILERRLIAKLKPRLNRRMYTLTSSGIRPAKKLDRDEIALRESRSLDITIRD